MATEIQANELCLRQSSLSIAKDIGVSIVPVLAEKLASIPALAIAGRDDNTKFKRKRVVVEFFYEPSEKNPWGDFATWNITETEVFGKTVTTTKSHFPDR